jgi:hypothetical protein
MIGVGWVETDRPGGEVSKDHRKIIEELVDNQGWAYKQPSGGGYPKLFPADRTKHAIRVPKTGHSRGRGLQNFIGEVRRAGGQWPPGRKCD